MLARTLDNLLMVKYKGLENLFILMEHSIPGNGIIIKDTARENLSNKTMFMKVAG